MENKIGKAILGLMTAILLMTAMIPIGIADIDGNTLINTSKLFVLEDDADSSFTLTWNTKNGANDGQQNLTLTIGNNVYTRVVNITDGHGTQSETITLNDLRTNNPAMAVGLFSGEIDVAIGALLTDTIWLEVVEDTSGRTNLNAEDGWGFIKDSEIEDQNDDDEINPEDTVVLTLELEGDNAAGYEDMTVQTRLTSGEEVLSDWIVSTEFTLSYEEVMDNEEALTFEFYVDEIVNAGQVYTIEMEADSDHHAFNAEFDFTVELEDDSLMVRNVKLSSDEVEAGESFTIREVRVYNNGEDVQENVMITAEIAELGIKSESENLGHIGNGDYETWKTTMGLPSDAKAGSYTLEITAESEDGGKDTYTKTITVTGAAKNAAELDAEERTKDVGSNGAKYTLTLKNNGDTIETYTLSVDGDEWASISLDNEVVIEAGQTKTIEVTVMPKAGYTGSKQFTVYAKANDETVDQVTLNANLSGALAQEQIIQVLQWIFAVIIIIAIILVIVWAVTKGRKDDEKEGAYY